MLKNKTVSSYSTIRKDRCWNVIYSSLFHTEKHFLVYWENEDSVSVVASSDVNDPPPEKAVKGNSAAIKYGGKICNGRIAEIGELGCRLVCLQCTCILRILRVYNDTHAIILRKCVCRQFGQYDRERTRPGWCVHTICHRTHHPAKTTCKPSTNKKDVQRERFTHTQKDPPPPPKNPPPPPPQKNHNKRPLKNIKVKLYDTLVHSTCMLCTCN